VGGVDDGLDLLVGHRLNLRVVADGEDSAGGHNLDEVGAATFVLADLLHGVDGAVDDATAPVGIGPGWVDAIAGIAVAAAGAEGFKADEDARTGGPSAVDGALKVEIKTVGAAHIADGGEALFEELAGHSGRADGYFRSADGEPSLEDVHAGLWGTHVLVHIDEAGEKCGVAEIDNLGSRDIMGSRFDRFDAAAGDGYGDGALGGLGDAVQHVGGVNDSDRIRLLG
jgi:hypothetical protein